MSNHLIISINIAYNILSILCRITGYFKYRKNQPCTNILHKIVFCSFLSQTFHWSLYMLSIFKATSEACVLHWQHESQNILLLCLPFTVFYCQIYQTIPLINILIFIQTWFPAFVWNMHFSQVGSRCHLSLLLHKT